MKIKLITDGDKWAIEKTEESWYGFFFPKCRTLKTYLSFAGYGYWSYEKTNDSVWTSKEIADKYFRRLEA